MTLREEIVEKIGERLELIKVANGYRTDLGNKVIYYYGAVDQGVEHIVYADADETYSFSNRVMENELSIVMQVVRYGENYGQLINEAIADVLNVFKTDKSLGLSNVYMTPQTAEVDIDQGGRSFVVVQIKFTVKYLTQI